MNTSTRRIAIAAALAVFGAGLGGGVGLGGSRAEAAVTAQEGWGSATVTVVHSETGAPLAGLPVTVQQVLMPDEPEGTGKTWMVLTDRMGNANFWQLPEGTYIAYIYYNNVLSEPVAFEIIQDFHPFVRVAFNPDID